MKKWIYFLVTLLIEAGLTYIIAMKFNVRFIELMFFTGLVFTVFVLLLSSSGGSFTQFIDSSISAQTGLIQKYNSFKFTKNPVFSASLLFLIVGLIFFILLIKNVIPPVK